MRSRLFFLPILAGILAFGACDGSSGPDEGRLTIQLTDSPGDLAEAWIQVDEVILLGSGPTTNRIELEPEVGGLINLLELAGGQILDLVEDVIVPAGTYSELRLVVGEAYVRLDDGRVFATAGAELPAGTTSSGVLNCPSCSQSGFKVKFMNGGVTVADNSTVLIDFDVAQSFGHEAGQSGQWIMRPVLKATTRSVQFGRIVGDVTPGTGVTVPVCGETAGSVTLFTPIAVAGVDTFSAGVDETGRYRVANLLPGTYTLSSLPFTTFTNGDTLSFVATATPATVTVAEGDSTEAAYEITAATCH
ncbi:MAG: DUF4382 domain-containing protein [Gemmatimonadota bacterium]